MSKELKRKIAFALLMGPITTGIITFSLLILSTGISRPFIGRWLSSWSVAYVIAIPVILFVGPSLQSKINRLIA